MPGILEDRISQKTDKTNDSKTHLNNEEEKRSYLSDEDISQLDALDEMMSEENFVLEKKRNKIVHRISMILLTIACTYIVVLIYGSFITEFYYNDKGTVAPVVMSVSDISDKNDYIAIMGLYLQTRSLYETLLTLDYRMAAGVEDTMSIAPEYESTLDTVSSLTTQIDAAVINSKYSQIKSMLLTWVQTHAAAYCQYMSTAVTQNDSDAASEAIAAREVLNSQFQLITQNMVTLGQDIKGYDLTDVEDWSPDGYVAENIEGVTGNSSSTSESSSTGTTDTTQSEATSDTNTESTDASSQTESTQATTDQSSENASTQSGQTTDDSTSEGTQSATTESTQSDEQSATLPGFSLNSEGGDTNG